MTRLARRLFMFCSAASLALAGIVFVAWIVSLFRTDTVGYVGWDDRAGETWQGFGVVSSDGRMVVYHFTSGTARFDESPHNLSGIDVPGMQPHAFHHGQGSPTQLTFPAFIYRHASIPDPIGSRPYDLRFAGVPHLAVAILLAATAGLPAGLRLLGRIRRRFRASPGHCPTCGYDLRATPELCPECGSVFTATVPR